MFFFLVIVGLVHDEFKMVEVDALRNHDSLVLLTFLEKGLNIFFG